MGVCTHFLSLFFLLFLNYLSNLRYFLGLESYVCRERIQDRCHFRYVERADKNAQTWDAERLFSNDA